MTERVSLNSSGIQDNYYSFYPSISADGRFVAFFSFASNLVTGDTNYVCDSFVQDHGEKVSDTTCSATLSSDQ